MVQTLWRVICTPVFAFICKPLPLVQPATVLTLMNTRSWVNTERWDWAVNDVVMELQKYFQYNQHRALSGGLLPRVYVAHLVSKFGAAAATGSNIHSQHGQQLHRTESSENLIAAAEQLFPQVNDTHRTGGPQMLPGTVRVLKCWTVSKELILGNGGTIGLR